MLLNYNSYTEKDIIFLSKIIFFQDKNIYKRLIIERKKNNPYINFSYNNNKFSYNKSAIQIDISKCPMISLNDIYHVLQNESNQITYLIYYNDKTEILDLEELEGLKIMHVSKNLMNSGLSPFGIIQSLKNPFEGLDTKMFNDIKYIYFGSDENKLIILCNILNQNKEILKNKQRINKYLNQNVKNNYSFSYSEYLMIYNLIMQILVLLFIMFFMKIISFLFHNIMQM